MPSNLHSKRRQSTTCDQSDQLSILATGGANSGIAANQPGSRGSSRSRPVQPASACVSTESTKHAVSH
ncbi:hypothetical protein TIFTF001_056512 [Ficus carica]|uniref:Uncharacterized protein n=1 Tax=Ficus carica TaxID=3494 RepID=A0AA88JHW7_FICCA|nr:hypothetical protein TIFTF001_056512 [Ficus carica]